MKFFKKAKRGFTLVELVVVIAVIAILAAVSVGAYFGVTDSANTSKLEQEVRQLHTAIKTISLGTKSNQSLGNDGLTVESFEEFEKDLKDSTGIEYDVFNEAPSVFTKPTIVLSTEEYTKEENNSSKYLTFEYYNIDITSKKAVSDLITGDAKVVNISSFDVNKDAEYKTVYFTDKDDWGEVYIHMWNNDGLTTTWPGIELKDLGNGLYSYDKILTSYTNFKFNNNNNGKESAEYSVANIDPEKNCYYNDTGVWDVVGIEDTIINNVSLVGSHNGWDAANGDPFTKTNDTTWTLSDVVLTPNDQWKVVLNGSWSVSYGYLNLDESSKNLVYSNNENVYVRTPAYYTISFNVENETISITKGADVEVETAKPDYVSLVGTMNNWTNENNPDIDLTSTDGSDLFTIKYDLFKNEEFKLRLDHAWDYSYGYSNLTETSKTNLEPAGENIKVVNSGVYNISYNYKNNEISIEKLEEAYASSFSVIGSMAESNWSEDLELTYNTESGLYEKALEDVAANIEFKIRYNANWNRSWNILATEGTENLSVAQNGNVLVGAEGDYVIKFNPSTLEISNTFTANVVDPGETPDPEPETPTFSEETFTVTFENNWLWTEVSIHYWKGENNNGWPGDAMELSDTKYSDYDFYTFEVPVDAEGYIFNGMTNDAEPYRNESPSILSTDVTHFNNENGYWYMAWNEGNEVKFICFPDSHNYEGGDGHCIVCGNECSHGEYVDGFCSKCGKEEPAAPEVVGNSAYGILGSMTGWGNDVKLFTTDNDQTALITIDLTEGDEFKFRKDGAWNDDYNLNARNLDETSIIYFHGSDNIVAEYTGTFTFTINISKKTISTVAKSEIQLKNQAEQTEYGLVGNVEGSNWQTNINFTTANNGKVFFIDIELLATSAFKIRKTNNWGNGEWGAGNLFSTAETYLGGDGDITVNSGYAGQYRLAFNLETGLIYVVSYQTAQ